MFFLDHGNERFSLLWEWHKTTLLYNTLKLPPVTQNKHFNLYFFLVKHFNSTDVSCLKDVFSLTAIKNTLMVDNQVTSMYLNTARLTGR